MNQPLNIDWVSEGVAAVSKDGIELGRFVARRTLVTDDRFVQVKGNLKSASVIGMIKGLSQWCGRSLTGFENSDIPCYSNPDGSGGCYANYTMHSMPLRNKGFNVIHNGFKAGSEAYGYIQLPKYGSYDLSPARARIGRQRMIWRVDSETADASASLALGQMQLWAEANPNDWFVAISSNYYNVSEGNLAWAASLPNLIVGHTFSPWFGEDDLQNRHNALSKVVDAGVRTQVWLATRPSWETSLEKKNIIDDAISMVRPTQLIEVAYHDRKVGHEPTTLNLNPLGTCCEVQVDTSGRRVKDGMVKVDGEMVPAKKSFGKCRGCRLLCGITHEIKSRKEVA